jgi:hypothetical protein
MEVTGFPLKRYETSSARDYNASFVPMEGRLQQRPEEDPSQAKSLLKIYENFTRFFD